MRSSSCQSGSSPHAWGILRRGSIMTEDSRFIPTCVGNTARTAALASLRAVHPHMRGEYATEPPQEQAAAGSSPHAWGIRSNTSVYIENRRFIPTCVGNTTGFCVLKVAPLVHPHMRGEYICWAGAFGWPLGSSPHAWGIRRADAHLQRVGRFIPTCVGNTWPADAPHGALSVHPHMRGEYDTNDLGDLLRTGSSPHAWGIHYTMP